MRVYDLSLDADGYSFRVATADEARLLALLRQVVSPTDLRWQAESGRWWLAPGYEATLGRLIENFGESLTLATSPDAAPHRVPDRDRANCPGGVPTG